MKEFQIKIKLENCLDIKSKQTKIKEWIEFIEKIEKEHSCNCTLLEICES